MGGFAIFPPLQEQVHINTPVEVAQQQATLGDILAQKQLRQQQVQDNQAKLQAQQQAQQDQQNFSRAYRDNNYDMDATLKAAPGYNVSADGMATRTAAHQKFQQAAVTLDDGKLRNIEAHGNLLAGYLDPIARITDPDQNVQLQKRTAAYADAYGQYQKVDPQGAQSVSPTYPGDDALQSSLERAMMIKGYTENALKTKQAAREDIQAIGESAKASTENAQAASRIMGSLDLSNAPPEAQQSVWAQQRSLLPAEAQKLVPPQWSPEAEAQVKRLNPTVGTTTNTKNSITQAAGALYENRPQDEAGFQTWLGTQNPAVQSYVRSVIPDGSYDPEKSPDALNRSLLTPAERVNKPAGAGTPEQQFVTEFQTKNPGATVAQAQRAYALNQHIVSPDAAVNTLDRETTRFAKPHEKSLADASNQLEKIADARAMINGSAESQALGIPKVLTALVSGTGSGIRITQPELNSIAQARGITGSVEGFINSVSGQGKLTDTQKRQLTQVLDDVQARIQQKREIANDALDKINGARSRGEIAAIDSDARKRLAGLETTKAGGGLPNGGGKVIDKATAQKFYDAAGKDPSKARGLAIQNNWKLQ